MNNTIKTAFSHALGGDAELDIRYLGIREKVSELSGKGSVSRKISQMRTRDKTRHMVQTIIMTHLYEFKPDDNDESSLVIFDGMELKQDGINARKMERMFDKAKAIEKQTKPTFF